VARRVDRQVGIDSHDRLANGLIKSAAGERFERRTSTRWEIGPKHPWPDVAGDLAELGVGDHPDDLGVDIADAPSDHASAEAETLGEALIDDGTCRDVSAALKPRPASNPMPNISKKSELTKSVEMSSGSVSSPSTATLPSHPPTRSTGTVDEATEDTPEIASSSSSSRSKTLADASGEYPSSPAARWRT